MKNIKELGLELIELENQVLLVQDKRPETGKIAVMIDKSSFIYGKYEVHKESHDRSFQWGTLIASTKPLEGLPLLVIEDEAKKQALKVFPVSMDTRNNITKDLNAIERTSFIKGYNKAKKTYKYTEEDICKFVEWMNLHYRTLEHTISFKGVEGTKELLTLWLKQNKKELHVDVELKETKSSVFRENDNAPFGKYQIKTTDNKIKAVWK